MRVILLIVFIVPFGLQAQHFSQLGRFSIEFAQGCASTTVHVTQDPQFKNPSYSYTGQSEFVSDTLFTYSTPGIHKIVQLISETIPIKTDTLTFTVFPPSSPDFDIYSCNGNELEIEVTDTIYDRYRIYFTDSDSVDISKNDANLRFQYATETASIRVKGLFNDSFNGNCGVNQQDIQIEQTLQAAVLDTAYFYRECDDIYQLNLQVSNTSLFKYLVEYKDGSNTQTLYEGGLDSELTFPNLTLTDESAKCVSIITIDPCTEQSISTEPYCLTPNLEALKSFYGAYASFSGSAVAIQFGETSNQRIHLEKKIGTNDYTLLSDTLSNQYLDANTNSQGQTYRLSYQSSLCESVSLELSAPLIKIKSKAPLTNQVSLNIVEPKNNLNQNDFTVSILFYNSDSTLTFTQPYENEFYLRPTMGEFQSIRLIYQYNTEGITLFSNELTTRLNYIIHVPKAFTPDNGDNLNDHLQFFGLPGSEDASLQIYNRWGEVIYESSDVALGWNGRTKQGKAQQGTYRYKVTFKVPNGELKSQVGTFVLIRK